MADVFTPTGSGLGSNLVTMAYDKLVEKNLRVMPQFRAIADKKVGNPTHDGSSIRFQFFNDIADTTIAGATLTETVDPDAVALPATTTLDVSQVELGRVVIPTRKLSLMSLTDIDPWVADAIAFNMALTLDNGVAAKLDASTQVIREIGGSLSTSGAVTGVTGTDTLKSRDIRYAVTKMRAANVMPKSNGYFVAYLHPEVSADLRTETGNNVWRTPTDYVDPSRNYAGEIGTWEGVRFIETSNSTNAQVGSGTGGTQTRVYNTYVTGSQALAEAVWKEPKIEFGNIVDKLNRFRPVGWHGMLNWAIYRQAALWNIQTAASGRPNA